MGKFIDLTGKTFNRLTVITREQNNKYNQVMWNCKCSCGNFKVVSSQKLKKGNTKSCGCLKKEYILTINKLGAKKRRKSFGESNFNELFSTYKNGAKRRNLDFKLTKSQFKKLTKQQCNYCGEFPHSTINKYNSYGKYVYNGIDRLDNNKGYIPTNVVTCCKTCNFLKGTLGHEQFLIRIKKIYNYTNLEAM